MFFSVIDVIGINAVIFYSMWCCIKNKFGDHFAEKKFGDQTLIFW
jgi:hypothetical protein